MDILGRSLRCVKRRARFVRYLGHTPYVSLAFPGGEISRVEIRKITVHFGALSGVFGGKSAILPGSAVTGDGRVHKSHTC